MAGGDCPGQLRLDLAGEPGPGPAPADASPSDPDDAATGEGGDTFSAQFAKLALEVCAGYRNPAQLIRWTTPEVQRLLERRHRLNRTRPTATRVPVRVVALRSFRPRPGVVEVAAVVSLDGRPRAVALRADEGDRRRITAFELG